MDILELKSSWLPPPHPDARMQPRSQLGHAVAMVCLWCAQILLWPWDKLREGLTWLAGRQSVNEVFEKHALQNAAVTAETLAKLPASWQPIGKAETVTALDAQAVELRATVAANKEELHKLKIFVTQARGAEARVVVLHNHLASLKEQVAEVHAKLHTARVEAQDAQTGARVAHADAKGAQAAAREARAKARSAQSAVQGTRAEVEASQAQVQTLRAQAKQSQVEAHAWQLQAAETSARVEAERKLAREAQAEAEAAWASALEVPHSRSSDAAYDAPADCETSPVHRALIQRIADAEAWGDVLQAQHQRARKRTAQGASHLGALTDELSQLSNLPKLDATQPDIIRLLDTTRLIRDGLESVAWSLRQG